MNNLITTVTLNPSIDKTIVLEKFIFGGMSRATSLKIDPSGKGVDVSRVVNVLGYSTVATGFIGGETGEFIEESLKKVGIKTEFVKIKDSSRTVYILLDNANKIHSSISEPSPNVRLKDLKRLKEKLKFLSKKSKIVVIAGSLPRNVSVDIYKEFVEICKKNNCITIVDAEGEILKQTLLNEPYLIKPNLLEAETILKKKLKSIKDIIKAADEFQKAGSENVLITFGKKGALLKSKFQIFFAKPPKIEVINTAGCGDGFIAGISIALLKNLSFIDALKLGTACASAVCLMQGTANCRKKDILRLYKEVKVKEIRKIDL